MKKIFFIIAILIIAISPIVSHSAIAATFDVSDQTRISTTNSGISISNQDVIDGISYATPDGRYVAIMTQGGLLVPPDLNGSQDELLVYDTQTSSWINAGVSDDEQGVSSVILKDIYYDPNNGHPKVIFEAHQYDDGTGFKIIDPAHPTAGLNSSNIFIRDVIDGTTSFFKSDPTVGDSSSSDLDLRISDDGRYMIFITMNALVPSDTNGNQDIYRYDTQTNSYEMVGNNTNTTVIFSQYSDTISNDGARVLFFADTSYVSTDTNNATDMYVYDFNSDKYFLASVDGTGNMLTYGTQTNNFENIYFSATLSPDGNMVNYIVGVNLVPQDANSITTQYDQYLNVINSDGTVSVSLLSKDVATGVSVGTYLPYYKHGFSHNSNLVIVEAVKDIIPEDTNNVADIYVYDITTGEYSMINKSISGTVGNGLSLLGSFISNTKVLYTSLSDNTTPTDQESPETCNFDVYTNVCFDLFIASINPVINAETKSPIILSPVDGSVLSSGSFKVVGSGEPNATIVVKSSSDKILCSSVVDSLGNWFCNISELSAGEVLLTATQTDLKGSVLISNSVKVTIKSIDPPIQTLPRTGIFAESYYLLTILTCLGLIFVIIGHKKEKSFIQ